MEPKKINIYLASPYTHPDPFVRDRRFNDAARAAAVLKKYGYSVFAPIPHSAEICTYGFDIDWTWWRIEDAAALTICECLVTLQLDGWRESKGLFEEVRLARELGLKFGTMRPTAEGRGIYGKLNPVTWDIDIPDEIIPAYRGAAEPTTTMEEQAA